MGVGVSGLCRRESLLIAAFQALSHAASVVKSNGVLFERAARKLGLNPFPAPMAIPFATSCGPQRLRQLRFLSRLWLRSQRKSSSLASMNPIAEKTGRCEISPHSYVQINRARFPRSRRRRCFTSTARKNVYLQKAKAVIVSANRRGDPTPASALGLKQFPMGLAQLQRPRRKNLMLNSGGISLRCFPDEQ